MLRRLLAAAIVCIPLFVVLAYAQANKTKEIKLPLSQMIGLATAISALDGPDRIVKDGANERVVKDLTAYKFEPGFKIAMSRNLTALKPILEGYDKELSVLRSEIAAGREIKDGSPELIRLNDENRRLLAVMQSANLFTFQESEFKLGTNQIPISVFSGLGPIVEFTP